MQALGFIGALTLGTIFLASGLAKLRDPLGFVLSVLEYDVLPRPLAIAFGRSLPPVEIVCGLALLAGIAPVAIGSASALLLLTFFAGVSVNLARGRTLDCHCFGSGSSESIGWMTVGRIVVLLACSAAVATGRGSGPLAPLPPEALPATLLAVALLVTLYLVRALPQQWPIWRITVPAQWKEPKRGRMVSLRAYPLVRPLSTMASRHGDRP